MDLGAVCMDLVGAVWIGGYACEFGDGGLSVDLGGFVFAWGLECIELGEAICVELVEDAWSWYDFRDQS